MRVVTIPLFGFNKIGILTVSKLHSLVLYKIFWNIAKLQSSKSQNKKISHIEILHSYFFIIITKNP